MKSRYRGPLTQVERERIEDSSADYRFLRENGFSARTALKVLGIAYKEKGVTKENGTTSV